MKEHFPRIVFLLTFLIMVSVSAQPVLSDKAEISVITCGPGTELYSSFGHSAFRVRDITSLNDTIDLVYNYGTFDFDTPNFYMKFARGKLNYALSRYPFRNFLTTYRFEERWVKEQVLDLTQEEVNLLFTFLEENMLPENRYYKYDFLFNNCATKIPEVLRKALGNELIFNSGHITNARTFRSLIQKNLHWNTWSSLGIDLALGSVIDREAAPYEYQFLPKYVRQQMQHTELRNSPLVEDESVLLDLEEPNNRSAFLLSPLFYFLLIFLMVLGITLRDIKAHTRSRWLDFTLLFLSGLAGTLIFFLWFFTDHSSTAYNANLLWAFPLNTIVAFFLLKKIHRASWIHRYIQFLAGCVFLLLCFWIMGIQHFAPLLILILATLLIRYALLLRLIMHES